MRLRCTTTRTNTLGAALAVAALLVALGGCSANTGQQPATRAQREASGSVSASEASRTPAPGSVVRARVVEVKDGDTVSVLTPDRGTRDIRLIGVDTPETLTRHDAYGEEASAFAKHTLQPSQEVWLEYDVEALDQYGRDLAYVWMSEPDAATAGTAMFNSTLLVQGFARLYTFPPNVKYTEVFTKAQTGAREANRGLWGLPLTEAAESQTVCVTPSGRAYHRLTCRLLGSKITTMTVAQALDRGKSACRVCLPPR
jgi:micrococcal nuclease